MLDIKQCESFTREFIFLTNKMNLERRSLETAVVEYPGIKRPLINVLTISDLGYVASRNSSFYLSILIRHYFFSFDTPGGGLI